MSDSLPERPDLGQLRRRAKELRDAARHGDAAALERLARHHPSAPESAVSLAAAQLVIARELGFCQLAAAEGRRRRRSRLRPGGRARSWPPPLTAGCGRPARSCAPTRASPAAACLPRPCSATPTAVREHAGRRPGGRGGHRRRPRLAAAAVRLLFAVASDRARPGSPGWPRWCACCWRPGPSPDTNDGGRARYRSALKGSVEVNNPGVTAAAARCRGQPRPGPAHRRGRRSSRPRCLRLLLAHGARVAGTWAVGAAVYHDDPGALSLLLDALRSSGGDAARRRPRRCLTPPPRVAARGRRPPGRRSGPRRRGSDGIVGAAPGGAGGPDRDRGTAAGAGASRGRHRRRPASSAPA